MNTMSDQELKELFKQAMTELLEERRDLFCDLFAEVLEEVGLRNAIREGVRAEYVTREQVVDALDSEP